MAIDSATHLIARIGRLEVLDLAFVSEGDLDIDGTEAEAEAASTSGHAEASTKTGVESSTGVEVDDARWYTKLLRETTHGGVGFGGLLLVRRDGRAAIVQVVAALELHEGVGTEDDAELKDIYTEVLELAEIPLWSYARSTFQRNAIEVGLDPMLDPFPPRLRPSR